MWPRFKLGDFFGTNYCAALCYNDRLQRWTTSILIWNLGLLPFKQVQNLQYLNAHLTCREIQVVSTALNFWARISDGRRTSCSKLVSIWSCEVGQTPSGKPLAMTTIFFQLPILQREAWHIPRSRSIEPVSWVHSCTAVSLGPFVHGRRVSWTCSICVVSDAFLASPGRTKFQIEQS